MLEHVEQGLISTKGHNNAVSRSTEDVEVAESLRRRVKQLETIARVGRTVTALLDLDEVLSEVYIGSSKSDRCGGGQYPSA